VVLEGMRR
jgi:hypothetical protein